MVNTRSLGVPRLAGNEDDMLRHETLLRRRETLGGALRPTKRNENEIHDGDGTLGFYSV
jgi:hypothetical protein